MKTGKLYVALIFKHLFLLSHSFSLRRRSIVPQERRRKMRKRLMGKLRRCHNLLHLLPLPQVLLRPFNYPHLLILGPRFYLKNMRKGTTCGHCNNHEKLDLKCPQCRTTYYCDKKCQKEHWKIHKVALLFSLQNKSSKSRECSKRIWFQKHAEKG
jgi:hypothetical protein